MEKPTSNVLFKGSCVCGRITYECTKLPHAGVQACHCITCRKQSGGAYQAFADIAANSVTLFDNTEQLKYEGFPKDNIGGIFYLSYSHMGERAFCVSCYSPLAMRYKHLPDVVGVTLGTVDEDSITDDKVKEGLKLWSHIFVSQKVWWANVTNDDLPHHDRFNGTFEQEMNAHEPKEG